MKIWMKELAALLADLLEYPTKESGGACEKIEHLRAGLKSRLRPAAPGPEEFDPENPAPRERAAIAQADSALEELAKGCKSASLLELQAAHSATFDFMPECSLFMSWHKYGDSPRQGRALAALLELYRDYGYSLHGANLPDYLPVMLEFMAAAPDQATEVLMDGFGTELRALSARIGSVDNLYAQAGRCLGALAALLAPEAPDALPAQASCNTRFKGGRSCTDG